MDFRKARSMLESLREENENTLSNKNEVDKIVARELHSKLKDKTLEEIINFTKQSSITHLIIQIIPEERLKSEISRLSTEKHTFAVKDNR